MNKAKIIQLLDLKGVPCPMNFVKVLLALEEIENGEALEVILDDGDPVKNVTASIKEEGCQILKVEQQGSYWELIIKKLEVD